MDVVEFVHGVELTGDKLRELITVCLEWGRTSMAYHGGDDRMAERNISGGQILAALARGALRTDQCVAGNWRYLASREGVEVCFMFDLDADGNMLIVITVMRKD